MLSNRLVSIAPMLECTDRHDRFFLRLIAPHVWLYTEMVTTGALIHGDSKRFLQFDPAEHPVALQLGGSDPKALAHCAALGEQAGYDEINLNVGCPSERVRHGRFGACLMLEPDLVADCVFAMQGAVSIPVTVKCRLGVDHQDSYELVTQFVEKVSAAGCGIFIIHARKAWLNGLSPKQNREVPPLRYDMVYQIKKDFPDMTIILNGGIKTVADIKIHLQHVDGVMIGREAYSNPYFLAGLEQALFPSSEPFYTRVEIVERFIPYVTEQLEKNIKLSNMTRHILGLFHGQTGGRLWRRTLSEQAYLKGAGVEVIGRALEQTFS